MKIETNVNFTTDEGLVVATVKDDLHLKVIVPTVYYAGNEILPDLSKETLDMVNRQLHQVTYKKVDDSAAELLVDDCLVIGRAKLLSIDEEMSRAEAAMSVAFQKVQFDERIAFESINSYKDELIDFLYNKCVRVATEALSKSAAEANQKFSYVCSSPCKDKSKEPCMLQDCSDGIITCDKGNKVQFQKVVEAGNGVDLLCGDKSCEHLIVGSCDGEGLTCVKCGGYFYF